MKWIYFFSLILFSLHLEASSLSQFFSTSTTVSGLQKRDIITASGSWVVPAGVTRIMVDIWGAGGGGGGTSSGSYGGTGGTGGSSSITGLVTVNGGSGGTGANSAFCNATGSGGAGGVACASTNAYECLPGLVGITYSWSGCTLLSVDGTGGTQNATTSPLGMAITSGTNYGYGGSGASASGGGGAYARGVFTVTPGQSLTITIGAGGTGGTGTSAGGVGKPGKVIIWY